MAGRVICRRKFRRWEHTSRQPRNVYGWAKCRVEPIINSVLNWA